MPHLRVLTLAAALAVAVSGPALGDGLEIAGRVEAEDGSAIADAPVALRRTEASHQSALSTWTGESPPPLARTVTDRDGFYVVRAPGPGMYRLLISAPGRAPVGIAALPLVEATVLPTATLAIAAEVAVRVVDGAGRGIAGARLEPGADPVDVDRPTWRPDSPALRTDRDGRATVLLAGPDRRVADWLATAAGFVGIHLRIIGPATVTLAAAAPTLEIRVRERDGRPVAGALVTGVDEIPRAMTGDDGRARLEPSAKLFEIRLADGRVWRGRLAAGPAGAPATIAVPPAPPVAGAVVDALDRTPLAGAVVAATSDLGHWAVADARGTYSLASEGDGKLGLMAWASGHFRGNANAAAWSARGPSLALTAGSPVSGWVVDAGRLPIAGASLDVEARQDWTTPFREPYALRPAASGRDGAFSTLGPPRGSASLRADARSFSPRSLALAPPSPGRRRPPLTVVLDGGRTVIGRVVDAGGAPVAGVDVRLFAAPSPFQLLFAAMSRAERRGAPDGRLETATDAKGTFRLRHVAAGRAGLVAQKEGFAPAMLPGLAVDPREPATDVGTIVLQPGSVLEGRVTDGHRPLAGARVSLQIVFRTQHSSSTSGLPPIATDPDGRFRLADLPKGTAVDLEVSCDGFVTRTLAKVAVPGERSLAIALGRAARITGRVLDESRSPVAGAQVRVQAEGGGLPLRRRFGGSQPTAEDGTFAIDQAPAGHVALEAYASGFKSQPVRGLEVPEGGKLDGVEIVLTRGATLVGTVTSEDGRPAAGATVFAGGGFAETDGDGAFRLEGLATGHLEVAASHPDLGKAKEDVEIGPLETRADLRLASGVSLEGRVADGAGAPVAGATVSLEGPVSRLPATAESDEQGSFRFEQVAAGRYRLAASLGGRRSGGTPRTVEVLSQPLAGLDLTLETGSALAGRILGIRPADLGTLSVEATGRGRPGGDGEIAADGSYRIEGLAPGDWLVTASADSTGRRGQGRATIAEGAGEVHLDITLGGGVAIQGTVRMNGQPVGEARVEIYTEGRQSLAADVANHLGAFRIEGLDRGPSTLRVDVPWSGLSDERAVDLEADETVDFDLQAGALGGSIVDGATGLPLAGVSVSIAGPGGEMARAQRRNPSDAGGRFAFESLLAGAYSVTVEKTGYLPQSATATVEAQGTAALTFTLVPGESAPPAKP